MPMLMAAAASAIKAPWVSSTPYRLSKQLRVNDKERPFPIVADDPRLAGAYFGIAGSPAGVHDGRDIIRLRRHMRMWFRSTLCVCASVSNPAQQPPRASDPPKAEGIGRHANPAACTIVSISANEYTGRRVVSSVTASMQTTTRTNGCRSAALIDCADSTPPQHHRTQRRVSTPCAGVR